MSNKEVLNRFNLRDGQFYAYYAYKNLWWFLDGERIGYGDLRDEDILYISNALSEGEEFVGWNEHHGSRWQQTKTPMVRITKGDFMMREEIIETEGR